MPLMAAYIAEMGMMITDMIIVGRLGSNELAAVGLAADWFYVLLLIGMGVISIVGVLVAQSFGEGNRQGIINAAEQGLIVAVLCSIPVMIAIWYLGPALQYARQDPDVIRLISDYSRPLALSVLPALLFVVLRNYVTALEKASGIMTITVVALAVNLALNYALVFGRFGMPALGVVGAAIGTTLVNWLMFFTLAIYVYRSRHFARYRPSLFPRRIHKATCKEIFLLGLPITGSHMLGGAMFTVAAIFVGMLGADILAAQLIVYSVIYFCLSTSVAFGDAVRVRVAYGIGIRSVDAARRSAKIAITLAAVVILVATLMLWLFPKFLVGIFLDTDDVENKSVLAIALGFSVYAGLFQLFDGVQIVLSNGLRGLKDTRSPFWISLLGYWLIGLGSGALLCFPMGFGAEGLWWGLIAGTIVAIALMWLRFEKQLKAAKSRLA